MLLTVDVGNSNIHLGAFAGAELLRDWRVHTDLRSTGDELALAIRGLLGPDAARITEVAALSTVPSLLRELRAMLPVHFGPGPHTLLEPGVRTGVPLLVDNPKEVGTDRVANTLAAHRLTGGAAIVVDFGTSTLVDVVSAKGEFLGGAIAPGVDISIDALAVRTVALRRVEPVPPRSVVGKNTVEALQSGIVYGFVGQVDGLVRRIQATLPVMADAEVIATGGLAPIIAPHCETITRRAPYLTLDGLRLVHERQAERRRR